MKKAGKILSLILVFALLMISAVACSNGNDSGSGNDTPSTAPSENTEPSAEESAEPSESAEPFVIGFSNVNDIYPYCIKFRDYLVANAEAEGMEVIVADAAGDAAVQNGQIDNFIVQGANVVTAISCDLDGSVPAVESAKAAGLPYISFLTSVRDEGNYPAYIYIGSKNYDAGLLQGQYLSENLPENAKILYLTGQPNDQQYIDRKAGLVDGLKDRTDVEILSEQNSNNTKDLGMSITEDWMQAYDQFDAIVGQNDDSVLGAIEVLKSAGLLDSVITVGLDGSDDGLASIANGELTMSVLQDAKSQAAAAVDVFKQLRDGVDPATIEDLYVPFAAITKDNVAEYME